MMTLSNNEPDGCGCAIAVVGIIGILSFAIVGVVSTAMWLGTMFFS